MSLEVKRSTVKNECWLHPGNKAHHINLSELERYQLDPPLAGDAAAPDIAVILVKSNQIQVNNMIRVPQRWLDMMKKETVYCFCEWLSLSLWWFIDKVSILVWSGLCISQHFVVKSSCQNSSQWMWDPVHWQKGRLDMSDTCRVLPH